MSIRAPAARLLALLPIILTSVNDAAGQVYPSRPVRMIVPFPASGVADFLARTINPKLSTALGQQVVIDNRPGAGTNIGSELVAKSPPDGYTILMASSSNVINPSLYRNLSYDPIRDFAPVSIVANVPMMLVVHPSLPVKSVKEFIALARKGPLSYASAGNGSPAHMAAELFKYLTKTSMVHIPYKGAPPAVTDVIAGQVPVMFTNLSVTLPHIQSGRLRALGYGGPKRSPALPDLPTISEAGVPSYDSTVWWGIVAPAKSPQDIVGKLNIEINKILQMEDIQQKFIANGTDPFGTTSDQMAAIMKADLDKWAKIVAASNAQVD